MQAPGYNAAAYINEENAIDAFGFFEEQLELQPRQNTLSSRNDIINQLKTLQTANLHNNKSSVMFR